MEFRRAFDVPKGVKSAWSVLAGLVVAACAAQRALEPVDPPATSAFDAALVTKGGELAAIGNCNGCHTAEGGSEYAGGRALATPFGTMYGTNITPDPETGIGRWSEAAFRRALREGVDREGRHLYPAFPYEYYTKLTDEDIRALYAYFMTREPVRATPPSHELRFPYNVRPLVGAWKALYFKNPGPFELDSGKNRGEYLVEALAHCSACHTPRNALGAERKDRAYAGGEAEGWHAPALDATNPAPVAWTREQLFTYLRTGLDDLHAIAAGPMDPVVRNLARVPEGEVQAIADYFAARMSSGAKPKEVAASADPGGPGATIYAGACGFCHDRGRDASSGSGLRLDLASAMTLPTAKNLVRITLEGIAPPPGVPGRSMPGFAAALDDKQVTALMEYCRTRFGGGAPRWTDVEEEVHKARRGP